MLCYYYTISKIFSVYVELLQLGLYPSEPWSDVRSEIVKLDFGLSYINCRDPFTPWSDVRFKVMRVDVQLLYKYWRNPFNPCSNMHYEAVGLDVCINYATIIQIHLIPGLICTLRL